jgi:hypothetical protein
MASGRTARLLPKPTWWDSFLFLALMSGPPKFRDRDLMASLQGSVDAVVLLHIGVWLCGGLWVLGRLFPATTRRGVLPAGNVALVIAALFIGSLTLSLFDSPGVLLTAFTVGQFAVMLSFTWLFTHRYGAWASLRLVFIGVAILALTTVALVFIAPDLVMYGDTDIVLGVTRIRGDLIADTGSLAVIGLVLCLSNAPSIRPPVFWSAFSIFCALLAGSRTRNAYVAFVGFLFLGFLYGKNSRVRKLFLPIMLLSVAIVLADALGPAMEYVVRERDSVENLSDRIPLWQYLTTEVMTESPLTGMGYYAASRVLGPQYNRGLGNAHSTPVEVLVGGGLIALVLYVLLCASLIWFAARLLLIARGHPAAVAASGLLLVNLVMGFTTPAALQPGPLGFVFWMLPAILPRLFHEASASARAAMAARAFRSPARVHGSPAAVSGHVR